MPEWSEHANFPITTVGQPAYAPLLNRTCNIFCNFKVFAVSFFKIRFVQPAKFDGGAESYIATALAKVYNDVILNVLIVG